MATYDRKIRQRSFYFRVTANFVIFCLFIVPLQFHTQWYGQIFGNDKGWLSNILRSGPMYFYALTLCIEANLRLEHYRDLLFRDWRIYSLRLLIFLPPSVFFMQYFISPLYKNESISLPTYEEVIQIGMGISAFIFSTIAHVLIVSLEKKRIR